MELDKMTTKQLEAELNSCEELINVIECYGVRDLLYRDAIYAEIEKRNLKIRAGYKLYK